MNMGCDKNKIIRITFGYTPEQINQGFFLSFNEYKTTDYV